MLRQLYVKQAATERLIREVTERIDASIRLKPTRRRSAGALAGCTDSAAMAAAQNAFGGGLLVQERRAGDGQKLRGHRS